jgi:elongation factor Tu
VAGVEELVDALDQVIPDPAREDRRRRAAGGRHRRRVVPPGRDAARAGDSVGLRLRGVERDQITRGQVLAAPGTVRPGRDGRAELYLLRTEEGGRHRPVRSGYRPQFFFGATDVTGRLELAPGDHAEVTFALDREVALEAGMRFSLREGGRTIGAGMVTAV